MSLADVCWDISSVFIVITLGVIAILCVLTLLGVFVCGFDHDDNPKNDKNSKGITMATNVTEKDKTLNEIIEWCEQLEVEGLRLANTLLMQYEMDAYGVVKGQIEAYGKTAAHCRSMLGYSGTMPTEVPNQSEDAK